jgi:hypothetical protein
MVMSYLTDGRFRLPKDIEMVQVPGQAEPTIAAAKRAE